MDCYNILKHSCTCSCQGLCECIAVDKDWTEISRWEMLRYIIKCKYVNWKIKRFLKKFGTMRKLANSKVKI